MRTLSPRSGQSQAGQALVYGIFFMLGGLAALYFLFNSGQLIREKTKLVNTADAVAYSAGVINARTLNFEAYTNRAMVANTVAVGQMVSLASWVKYADSLEEFHPNIFEPKYDPYPETLDESNSYVQKMKDQLIDSGSDSMTNLLKLANMSDRIVRLILMNAQKVADAGMVGTRLQVMKDVANKNYEDDGVVKVDDAFDVRMDYENLVQRYKRSGKDGNDERGRFADLVRTVSNMDPFMAPHAWSLPDTSGMEACGYPDWLERQGLTELLGNDQWVSNDLLNAWEWRLTQWGCYPVAHLQGVGYQSASRQSNSNSSNSDSYSWSQSQSASSDDWDYSGLPDFYDLTKDNLNKENPKVTYSVRLTRAIDQTITSEGRSELKQTATLNDYSAKAGNNYLAAVSTTETFFKRPQIGSDGAANRKNTWVYQKEKASLFNPFWQTHLIQSDSDIQKAQGMQGSVIP